jgi:predicted RNA-binding Zn ribbon-like protein
MAELCLNFANTLCWRGSDSPSEALHSLDEVLAWCVSAGVQEGAVVEHLRDRWRAHPAETFVQAIGLREVIYRVFKAAAMSQEPALADLDEFNAALAAAPARRRVERCGDGYAWQIGQPAPTIASLLAPVLWSTGDLLTRPELRRVRQCANDKCIWLFLDDSKSGSRRWCSMAMCGNRAKAQRHYLRTKQPPRRPL